jgi:hypothetical protein
VLATATTIVSLLSCKARVVNGLVILEFILCGVCAFYLADKSSARLSTREVERQINSRRFERVAISRDKVDLVVLVQRGHGTTQTADLVKVRLVLAFAGSKGETGEQGCNWI